MRGTYESEQRADRRNSLFQLILNYKGEIDMIIKNAKVYKICLAVCVAAMVMQFT